MKSELKMGKLLLQNEAVVECGCVCSCSSGYAKEFLISKEIPMILVMISVQKSVTKKQEFFFALTIIIILESSIFVRPIIR
jgi:hypothetical protein